MALVSIKACTFGLNQDCLVLRLRNTYQADQEAVIAAEESSTGIPGVLKKALCVDSTKFAELLLFEH